MQPNLFIALPATPGEALELAEGYSERIQLINQLRTPSLSARMVAFAPAACVAHFRMKLAARHERDALQAAFYAIENELAQPIEEIHVTLGPRSRAQSERDIYAIDKVLLQVWIDQLTARGLGTARIVPEQCLLREHEDGLTLGNRALYRAGDRIIGLEAGLPGEGLKALGAIALASLPDDGASLVELAQRSRNLELVDMRSGPFSRKATAKDSSSSWRVAAGIAMAALSIWTGSLILERRNFDHSTKMALQQAQERYSRLFPGRTVPVDLNTATRQMIASQMEDRLSGFLPMTASLFDRLNDFSDVRIRNLTYDDTGLNIELTLPSTLSAASVMQGLESPQARVTLEAVEPTSEGNIVRFKMEAVR